MFVALDREGRERGGEREREREREREEERMSTMDGHAGSREQAAGGMRVSV